MQPRLSGTCMHARSVTVECSMRSVCFLVKVLAPFVFHLRMGFLFSTPTFLLRASVGLLDRGTYLENNLTVTQGTCITDKGTARLGSQFRRAGRSTDVRAGGEAEAKPCRRDDHECVRAIGLGRDLDSSLSRAHGAVPCPPLRPGRRDQLSDTAYASIGITSPTRTKYFSH
jgi:hypothetical protein